MEKETLNKMLLRKKTRKELFDRIKEIHDFDLMKEVEEEVLTIYSSAPKFKKFFSRIGDKIGVSFGVLSLLKDFRDLKRYMKVIEGIRLAEPYWVLEQYKNGNEEINSIIDSYKEILNKAVFEMVNNGNNYEKAFSYVSEIVDEEFGINYGEDKIPFIRSVLDSLKEQIILDRTFQSQNTRNNKSYFENPNISYKEIRKKSFETDIEYIKRMKKEYGKLSSDEKERATSKLLEIYRRNRQNRKIVLEVLRFGKKHRLFFSVAKIEINNKYSSIRKEAASLIYKFTKDKFLIALYSSSFVRKEEKKKNPSISYEALRDEFEKMSKEQKEFLVNRIKIYLNQEENKEIRINAIELIRELNLSDFKEDIKKIIKNSKGAVFKRATLALVELCQ